MAVYRVEKNKNFTVMSNHHFKNKTLSNRAKGLLSLMLSLPEDWDYTTNGLAALSKDGKDAIQATVRELEQHGYIIRNKVRGERGRFSDIEYVILEEPRQGQKHKNTPEPDSPEPENPFTVNPALVSPGLDSPEPVAPEPAKPPQLNTNLLNTNLLLNTNGLNPNQSIGEMELSFIDHIKCNISYDSLIVQIFDRDLLDSIVVLMAELLHSNKDNYILSGDMISGEMMRYRIAQLNDSHIIYVMECISTAAKPIHNVKNYMIACLYNAPVTIETYYQAQVNADFQDSN